MPKNNCFTVEVVNTSHGNEFHVVDVQTGSIYAIAYSNGHAMAIREIANAKEWWKEG